MKAVRRRQQQPREVRSAPSYDIAMSTTSTSRTRELNVVFASVGCNDAHIVDVLLPRLTDLADVAVRAVLDPSFGDQPLARAAATCTTLPNASRHSNARHVADVEHEAAELATWADLLVLAPIDASSLAKMLDGHTGDLLLELLRSWNVSKKILLLPGMSTLMWENPMTKKQLTKIRRKWNWIQLLTPVLWGFDAFGTKKITTWEAVDELVEAVRNQIDLMNIGQGVDVSATSRSALALHSSGAASRKSGNRLPPELWTMVFDRVGDWELAQNLHVYTNIAPPLDWEPHTGEHGPQTYMETLEWTILRGNLAEIKAFLAADGAPRRFSKLCLTLIMRFALTPLLAHLENQYPDLFWATFGHTFLPVKASSVFGRTEILEFWRTSPSFLSKEYTEEALDGASRLGFIHVLEWWRRSGLPLKYTEAALESASSHGHVAVLEWWKAQALASTNDSSDDHNATNGPVESEESAASLVPAPPSPRVRLKPGKSISHATQNGHTSVVRWWLHAGVPFAHEDTVAKLASTHGHVAILQLWHSIKGSKMIFDHQVLPHATKHGCVDVLEWWKRSGLKVEYRICDIEEALEDGMEGQRGTEVRRWWARNGLNLGVGTSEWMKTKVLGS